jgi:hypothetical protein
VVESTDGERFGGFTSLKFGNVNVKDYIPNGINFLFSLSKKKIYS